MTSLDLTTGDIRAATRILPTDRATLFVAKHGSIAYGLARMIQAYAAGTRDVRVVQSLDRARELMTPVHLATHHHRHHPMARKHARRTLARRTGLIRS